MKKIIILTLIIVNLLMYIPTMAQSKKMNLNNKIIVIDPGHGGKDKGTSYNDIYEKDINLKISIMLKEKLEIKGATVIMTREGDYDLSTPNTKTRKKSDFNNRIKIINEYKPDLIISIHQNYFIDSKYNGTQIFYKNAEFFAEYLQENINNKRVSKPISNSLYMYNKIKSSIILIECGFLSNPIDRKNLTNTEYIKEYTNELSMHISEYFKKHNKIS